MTTTDPRDAVAPLPVRGRVLLVGGEPRVVEVCREFLSLLGDRYDVESIDYCDDALTLLRHRRFDAVLMLSLNAPWRTWSSLSSPAQSSLGSPARRIEASSAILFLKQIRALLDPPPVIVVSGHLGAKATALANGAVAFVLKPIILAELEEALNAILVASRLPPGV